MSSRYRAGIVGASGYTGLELVKLIHRHPHLELGWLTGERTAGQTLSQVHPGPWDLPLIPLEEAYARAGQVDAVFLCLPHGASMAAVQRFHRAGLLVIDLSADFRLPDPALYTRWYGVQHTAPELLAQARYGLCELFRETLRGSRLIAVPGCYPTSVNLGLYPLARAGWLGDPVIVDAKSGISGAGRKVQLRYHFVEANENIAPYSPGRRHRHIAEMELVLNRANGPVERRFLFTPHLLPVSRGILSTMYVRVPPDVDESAIWALYRERYAGEPFIHLLPPGQLPSLAHTVHTNRCAIGLIPVDPGPAPGTEYVVAASIDNLLKGASGQAIQCFNIAVGLDETAGLL